MSENDLSAAGNTANQSSLSTPAKHTPENTITNDEQHRRMSHQGSLEKGNER
jgi:hypothetical protein